MPNLPIAPFGEIQVSNKDLLTYVSFHYNINTELVTTTTANSGTVTQANSAAVLAATTAANSSAIVQSRLPARYIAGQGLLVVFSAKFSAGDLQEAGFGNASDAFLFDYNAGQFGINRRSSIGGVTNNRIAKANWSETLDFEFNPFLFNVYGISFQWLGAGEIIYWIESPHIGTLIPVHKIRYANSASVLSLLNPSLPLWARALNTGEGAASLAIGNMAAYVFGKRETIGIRQAERLSFAYTTGAERTLLAIENMASVFGGTNNNRSALLPTHFSWSTDGTKPAIFRLKRCTISGGTNADVNTNTSIAKKFSGTPTVSNTKLLFSIEAAKDDKDTFLIPDDFLLAPGEAIIATVESAANSDVSGSFSWKELL